MSIDLMRFEPHFLKNMECPLTQVKNFRIKLGFICTFNLCVGCCSARKIAFRNFKNSLMLIYTFRFEKLKNEISTAQKLVELPQCAFLKLLKFLISDFLNSTLLRLSWLVKFFSCFQVFFLPLFLGACPPNPLGDVEFDQWLDFAKPSTTSTFRNRLSTLSWRIQGLTQLFCLSE